MRICRIYKLFYNSCLSIFKTIPFFFKKAKRGRAKVIIRFDDYGVWCNSDWITIEEEIIKLHEKYGIKISFGVIPNSKYPLLAHPLSPSVYPKEYENIESNPFPLIESSKRVDILKKCVKKRIAEVTLHGYNHPKGYSNTNNTEFYGFPYELQYYKLKQGKEILKKMFDCNISTFIPPHNTYDNLTLNLMYDLGFKCISGAYTGNYLSPRCNSLGLIYLWYRYDDVSSMYASIAKKCHYLYEPLNVIMLHHTNFTKDGKIDSNKLDEYESFLKYLKDNEIENYCFSDTPEHEIRIFDTVYFLEKDNVFLRVLRKKWPAVACNYIEYNVNKITK